jgi:hypothetical protein
MAKKKKYKQTNIGLQNIHIKQDFHFFPSLGLPLIVYILSSFSTPATREDYPGELSLAILCNGVECD